MHPVPLLVALVLLAILALRRRTLGRLTGAAGLLIAIVLTGYGFGLYTLPSVDDALTRLAPKLGSWTYALVGSVSIELLFAIVWLAAIAGDSTGFLLGRKLGRGFLFEHGPRFHITPG